MEILFLIAGLVFAFIGMYLIWDHIRFLRSARTVTGTVVAIDKRTTAADGSRREGGPIYYPVIKYFADGQSKEFTSSYGMSMPQFDLGETVPVAYSRTHRRARIHQKMPFVMGGIFTAVGLGMSVLFFHIFRFSPWSVGIAAVVIAGVLRSGRQRLRQHDINTLDELKEAFRNTDMKTSRGTEPEESYRISDRSELRNELRDTARALRWAGPLMTVIGIAVLALGIYLGRERAAFLEMALQADGEVVSLNSKSSDDGYVYYPVVRYTPPGGTEQITFEHDTGSNPPSYRAGDPVTVLYHPDNPRNAIIDGGVMNWFGAGIALLLGLCFTAAGIYSIRYWRKLRNSRETIFRGR